MGLVPLEETPESLLWLPPGGEGRENVGMLPLGRPGLGEAVHLTNCTRMTSMAPQGKAEMATSC